MMSVINNSTPYNLYNQDFVFRIGAFPSEPDVFNCFTNLPKKPCERPGAEMELVQIVMTLLNWNWTVVIK